MYFIIVSTSTSDTIEELATKFRVWAKPKKPDYEISKSKGGPGWVHSSNFNEENSEKRAEIFNWDERLKRTKVKYCYFPIHSLISTLLLKPQFYITDKRTDVSYFLYEYSIWDHVQFFLNSLSSALNFYMI